MNKRIVKQYTGKGPQEHMISIRPTIILLDGKPIKPGKHIIKPGQVLDIKGGGLTVNSC